MYSSHRKWARHLFKNWPHKLELVSFLYSMTSLWIALDKEILTTVESSLQLCEEDINTSLYLCVFFLHNYVVSFWEMSTSIFSGGSDSPVWPDHFWYIMPTFRVDSSSTLPTMASSTSSACSVTVSEAAGNLPDAPHRPDLSWSPRGCSAESWDLARGGQDHDRRRGFQQGQEQQVAS